MIDRRGRDECYDLVTRFLRGLGTAEAVEQFERELTSTDRGLKEVAQRLWFMVADHDRLEPPTVDVDMVRDSFLRYLLFLRSDESFRWPKAPGFSGCWAGLFLIGCTGMLTLNAALFLHLQMNFTALPMVLLGIGLAVVLVIIVRIVPRVWEEWSSSEGDLDAWPFHSLDEYRRAEVAHRSRLERDAPGLFSGGNVS